MIHVRAAALVAAFAVATVVACKVQDDDNANDACPSSEVDSGAQPADSGASISDAGSDASTDNPDPTRFLPIPDGENVIRVVANGGDWAPYDRTCNGLNDADSHHSIGFGDTYIQPTSECADKNGENALFKVYRAAGLAAGVYDIAPGGDVRSKAGLTPPDRPWVEADLAGRLWIRTVTVTDDDTLLEASYYGTAQWPTSSTDSSLTEVTVQVALKARLRNTDVP